MRFSNVYVCSVSGEARPASIAIDDNGAISDISYSNLQPRKDVALEGAYIYPGLVDAHLHLLGTGQRILEPRLEHLSLDAVLETVVSAKVERGWILLRGWDHTLWGDALPTSNLLDNIRPDVPIALMRVDGHALWCNSLAMEVGGIAEVERDPEGGRIVRLSDGQPSGILLDEAMKLVLSRIEPLGSDELKRRFSAALEHIASMGCVEIHDMGVGWGEWAALKELYAEHGDELPRAEIFADMHQANGIELFRQRMEAGKFDDSPHPRLRLTGIKIYLDGALGSRGAKLLEPYSDDSNNLGLDLAKDDEVVEWMRLADRKCRQIAVHAIGDAAVRRALDLFERAELSGRITKRIEHAQLITAEDLPRFAALGVRAVIQPKFFVMDRVWVEQRIGPERMPSAYRWRGLVTSGATVVGSSDSPIEPCDPLADIRILMGRDGVQDGEALSLPEALRAYTSAPRVLSGTGWGDGLAVGHPADLTFLSGPVESAGTTVLGTMVEGRFIFRNGRDS